MSRSILMPLAANDHGLKFQLIRIVEVESLGSSFCHYPFPKSELFIKFAATHQIIRKSSSLLAATFTFQANRSHSIGFVVARVRLGRFVIVYYDFMSHCLAATATSVRE